MKKLVIALALCLLPVAAARMRERQPLVSQKESAKPTPTPQAPYRTPLEVIPEELFDHELKDLDGRGFYLSNYRGQVFVINVWATWCVLCRSEIPQLNKIYKEYRGRGVEFVGLTIDKPETDSKAVREFAAQLKMKYKLGWLDAEASERLLRGRMSVPQTFVVTPNGRIDTIFVGYSEWEQTGLRQSIENALTPYAAAVPRP